MKTLVLNSGSSSIKYCLFDMTDQAVVASGIIEKIGAADSLHQFKISDNGLPVQKQTQPVENHQQGLQLIFDSLLQSSALNSTSELYCIGHRVVHGGEYFSEPVVVNDSIINKIKDMSALAPLHNPANMQGIKQALKQFGHVPQVAVFDTAFHQSIPQHAYRYAVPADWYNEFAVRRYGFHGTSHQYVAKQAAEYLSRPLEKLNLISLHLGNGASVTAIQQGKSIDTSMGLTPLEGLMMGTRSGDIDPAMQFYLSRVSSMNNAEIERALNSQSGLKGICGENDMRAVHRLSDAGDKQAQLALQMYAYRIKKYIGAYYAILGQVDAVIFTGGIGENDSWLREQCCSNLNAFGLAIDSSKNSAVDTACYSISKKNQAVEVLVIKTNEELEIALQSVACVKAFSKVE